VCMLVRALACVHACVYVFVSNPYPHDWLSTGLLVHPLFVQKTELPYCSNFWELYLTTLHAITQCHLHDNTSIKAM